MKITVFLIVFSVASVMANRGHSQETKFSVQLTNTSLLKILNYIEENSHYYFMYNNELIDLSKRMNVDVQNKTIDEILSVLFEKTGINYKIYDRQIVLSPLSQANGNFSLQQQAHNVSGKVTDASGEALPGASIVIKGTSTGIITDAQGSYSLPNVPPDAVLVFSFVGMKAQEIAVAGKKSINVAMEEETFGIEEVVAIGYGTQKKSSITGSISTMPATEVESIPVPNLSNALAGRISGLFVKQASGAPGYAASIRVRSVNTWKDTGNDPLYVIDGVLSDKSSFDALDYSEVEDITVLRDAASGAIYGARAANGVLLVTTKTGKSGKLRLNYGYSYSFDQPSKIPEYMNSGDAIDYMNLARAASGQAPFADDNEVAYYHKNDPAKDYYDKAYHDPVLQRHSLTASGGSDNVKYFVGASHFNQEGFIERIGYEKLNVRSNLDINFTDELSGTFKISYNEGIRDRFSFVEDMSTAFNASPGGGNLWGRLLYYMAFTRPTTTDGHFINAGWAGNMLGFIKEGGTNKSTEQNTDFQIGLNYKVPFIKGMSLSARYSKNHYLESIKHYEIKTTLYNVVTQGTHGLIYTDEITGSVKSPYPSPEKLGQRQITSNSYQLNLGGTYERAFGKHNVSAMFMYEQSEGLDNTFYGVEETFPLVHTDQFWASGSSRENSYVGGSDYEYGRASYIGRLSYQYDDKYFLNATIRRDGSMLFAPGYRWGNFPSVSLGWILSNENFLQEGFFDHLKLRASWGLAGNDAVGGWEWAESYSTSDSYMMGASAVKTIVYDGIVNGTLNWEKTREFNVGLDTRFLKSFIFNMDYYSRHNYDILDSRIVSLPASFGGAMPPVNYGIVNGHGLEFELGYSNHLGKLNYEVRGNLAYAVNKVKERDVAENVRDVDNPLNRSTDYVACLVSKGIIRTQADLDALPGGYTIYGKQPALGALCFEDVSGLEAGVPDGKIDDYDRQVINGKHYTAPLAFGLNLTADWKGFEADIFFQGSLGLSKMYEDGFGRRFHDGTRSPIFWLDSWTPENTDAAYPQAVTWDYTYDYVPSTFWLKRANYLRLQYVNLSYSLPRHIVRSARLSSVKLFLSGTNLFTITPFDYYDVMGAATNSYPTMKTYSLGINVTF